MLATESRMSSYATTNATYGAFVSRDDRQYRTTRLTSRLAARPTSPTSHVTSRYASGGTSLAAANRSYKSSLGYRRQASVDAGLSGRRGPSPPRASTLYGGSNARTTTSAYRVTSRSSSLSRGGVLGSSSLDYTATTTHPTRSSTYEYRTRPPPRLNTDGHINLTTEPTSISTSRVNRRYQRRDSTVQELINDFELLDLKARRNPPDTTATTALRSTRVTPSSTSSSVYENGEVDSETSTSRYRKVSSTDRLPGIHQPVRNGDISALNYEDGSRNRVRVSQSSESGVESRGLVGLKNIGNTCFMNSVLQSLSNTLPLLEYCAKNNYQGDINRTTSGMKGSLVKAFAQLVCQLWDADTDSCINPSQFKSSVQKFAPRFMGYLQQDAQEFLRYLLEGIHDDVNRVKTRPKRSHEDGDELNDKRTDRQKSDDAWYRYLQGDDSRIVDVFVGQLKSTLECCTCHYQSVTFDPFWDLSLPIPKSSVSGVSLTDCLKMFTKEEILDDDEQPTCASCRAKRKSLKSFTVQKFPKVLVLHLKRFSQQRYRAKLSTQVDFPVRGLDLSNFASTSYKGVHPVYDLYAVVNHSGGTHSGHYTAYVKHPYSGDWHEYNDSRVSKVSSRQVVSEEAYLLFYELQTQSSRL